MAAHEGRRGAPGSARAPRAGRRLLLACAVVAATATAVPAANAAPVATETVTLSGTRTASVLVSFDRPVDFRAGGAASEYERPHVTTTGGAVGFALLPAAAGSQGVGMFGVRVPSADGTRPLVWPSGDRFAFGRGVYRLVLITNGPGSVRFRLPGLRRGVTAFRPRTNVRARITTHATDAAVVGASYAAVDSYEGTRWTRVLDYMWFRGPVSATARSSACFWEGRPAQSALPGCAGGTEAALVDRYPRVDVDAYTIGNALVAAGTWTVRTEITTAGVLEAAGAVIIWLDA